MTYLLLHFFGKIFDTTVGKPSTMTTSLTRLVVDMAAIFASTRRLGTKVGRRYVPIHDGSILQLSPAGHLSQWAQVYRTTWPNCWVLRNSVSFCFFA